MAEASACKSAAIFRSTGVLDPWANFPARFPIRERFFIIGRDLGHGGGGGGGDVTSNFLPPRSDSYGLAPKSTISFMKLNFPCISLPNLTFLTFFTKPSFPWSSLPNLTSPCVPLPNLTFLEVPYLTLLFLAFPYRTLLFPTSYISLPSFSFLTFPYQTSLSL